MRLKFKNMTCAGCALDIEWELNQLEQVKSANVDVLQAIIDIEFEGDPRWMREQVVEIGRRYESGFELVEETKVSKPEPEPTEAVWRRLNYLLPRVIASVLFLLAASFAIKGTATLVLYISSYLLAGGDILWKALKRLSRRDFFHEYFLMSLATLGAFAIGEYQEAVAVMVFYQIGEYLQDKAVERSKESIEALMKKRTVLARVLRKNKLIEVEPEEVNVGERILVRPGEEVPLDGILIQGVSSVNNAAISGESLPQPLEQGDEVTAGAINLDGPIKLEVTKMYQDSGMARIMRLMREAKGKKPPTEKFISRFARSYTKAVVLLAVLTALLPTLLGGDFSTYLYRALIFLVVSCPCALVVSVPLGFFAGMGGFSKHHLLIKDPDAIEQLSRVKRIGFDKTNTLTEGEFILESIEVADGDEASLMHLVSSVERHSNHPLAKSILQAEINEREQRPFLEMEEVREVPGRGLLAKLDGEPVVVGNRDWLLEHDVGLPELDLNGTYVYAARSGKYLGRILLKDELKEKASESLEELRRAGVRTLVMLTGDNEIHAKSVAEKLELDSYEANLKPEDKLAWVEKQDRTDGNMAFVGDGINDAPSLVAADVGIAMGTKGTDLAIESAGLVVMRDRLGDLPKALKLAKRCMRVIRQNIVLAVGLKVLVMLLGLAGLADLWMAVFADVGVTLLAVLNSMRLLR